VFVAVLVEVELGVFVGVRVLVLVDVTVGVDVFVGVLVGLLATMVKAGSCKLPVGLFEQDTFNSTELSATIANKMTTMIFFIRKPS